MTNVLLVVIGILVLGCIGFGAYAFIEKSNYATEKANNATLSGQVADLKGQLKTAQQTNADDQKQITKLQNDQAAADQQIIALQKAKDTISDAVETAKEKIANVKISCPGLNAALTDFSSGMFGIRRAANSAADSGGQDGQGAGAAGISATSAGASAAASPAVAATSP